MPINKSLLFSPLHSIDFTEELLEAHEAEAAKVPDLDLQAHSLFYRNLAGEEIPPRQQGAVQQSCAEAGGVEQVYGVGEESQGGLMETKCDHEENSQ